jgi:hypothetical protein
MDNTSQQDEGDARPGDLLVGAASIHAYLVSLGMPPKTCVYYLKRSGWPIGGTAARKGKLIASKRRLIRHVERLTRGAAA